MKVAVAGGSGFIGTATVRALHSAGHEVLVLSRSNPGFPPGVRHHSVDLTQPLTPRSPRAAEPPDPLDWLRDADAVVNLVGIAIETPNVSFHSAHVSVVEHLIDACTRFGIDRFVHVSVVRIEASTGAYHRTKRAGEALVSQSELEWTILRPGLVYGPGDDMMSNLVGFVRAAPVFAVPAGVGGGLAVVDVDDVAIAVSRSLDNRDTHRQRLDVVGPERLQLPELIGRVSAALDLKTVCVPLPRAVMRTAAGVMERLLPRPPVTRTQLEMLIEGLYGDPAIAASRLALEPAALSAERIREIAAGLPTSAGPPSVRLLPTAKERATVKQWRVPLGVIVALTLLMACLPWPDLRVPPTMLAINLVAVGVLAWKRNSWVGLSSLHRLAPARALGVGLACSLVGLMLAQGSLVGLRRYAPEFVAGAAEVVAWGEGWRGAASLVGLTAIVALEDLVWRFAVTASLVRRCGPWGAAALGALLFALAHATVGPPVLVFAAAAAGFGWNLIALRTRSWLAVTTCHLSWDIAMLMSLSDGR